MDPHPLTLPAADDSAAEPAPEAVRLRGRASLLRLLVSRAEGGAQ